MLTTSLNAAGNIAIVRAQFADLADLLTGAYVTRANRAAYTSKISEIDSLGAYGPSRWYGGIDSRATAESLMRDGWQDGAKQASALAPKLTDYVAPVKSVRRRAAWSEDGTEIHIDRAMRGEWDRAFRTSVHTASGTPRVLSLGCNFGGNAGISHEQLFWCAAQMIVATDLLEAAGYAVELHALKCNTIPNNGHVLLDVTVKQPDQPLRADAVASVFGHAGVYRSFGHVLLCSSLLAVGDGLGSPTDVRATHAEVVAEGLTDTLDYVLERAYSIQQAATNVTKALTTLTGPFAND